MYMETREELEKRKQELEEAFAHGGIWQDKQHAQACIKELEEIKNKLEGVDGFDKGPAIITLLAGAGGDDAEDFVGMLALMYEKFCDAQSFVVTKISEHPNTLGGYRTVVFEVTGSNAYKTLKHEQGVHRLVRVSPFNAKGQRHTSFALVEVLPKLEKGRFEELPKDDLRIEFSKSSGPGGQNVNKRETAVRIVHIPTNISVHADNERTQEANKERALTLLTTKVHLLRQQQEQAERDGLKISKTTEIEWGNQIRSYVLHPYKLVKDHRTGVEVRDVDAVFSGNLEPFVVPHR